MPSGGTQEKVSSVLPEETEEERLQRHCTICNKLVFSFNVKGHMASHARRLAEAAAKARRPVGFLYESFFSVIGKCNSRIFSGKSEINCVGKREN